MVTLLRGLCLVLLLAACGSCYRADGRRESPNSSAYWDQAHALDLRNRGLQLRTAGDYVQAEGVYRAGLAEARRRNDAYSSVKFLISIGGCQIFDFRYREAMATFLEARKVATAIQDHEDAGAIALNLSNLYRQMWDFPAALKAAEDGIAEAGVSGSKNGIYYRPQLLMTVGRLRAARFGEDASPYFLQAIESARDAGKLDVEPLAWDLLGESRLNNGELESAERALCEAFRMRVLRHSGDVGYSYALLGALYLARHNLPAAAHFTELAIRAARSGAPTWPLFRLWHQRGEIDLAGGHTRAALADLSRAVDEVSRWRGEIIPARSTLTRANVGLEQKIFHSFIPLAAKYAVEHGSAKWAARAWEAVEANRAAALRTSLAFTDIWKEKLPAEYWELLGRLGAQQARRRGGAQGAGDVTSRLALKITEMEAQAGIQNKFKNSENFRTQSSLNHFQNGISESELLLSFSLGEADSYLWAIGRDSLGFYRIAGEKEIAARVKAFREAIRRNVGGNPAVSKALGENAGSMDVTAAGTRTVDEEGAALYRMLFGQLTAKERSKRRWLLSLDGELFELPFAALVVEDADGRKRLQAAETVYLVDRHSLQIVPGASLLRTRETVAPAGTAAGGSGRLSGGKGWLLAVGDPIYNSADPRWVSSTASRHGYPRQTATDDGTSAVPGQFARLVGSAGEVRAVAHAWGGQSGTVTVLEGSQARRGAFCNLLNGRPSVIHLATHVAANPEGAWENNGAAVGAPGNAFDVGGDPATGQGREQSFIAFSLAVSEGRTPVAEVLSTTEIGGLRVPEALVVMTGCDSGVGEATAGAGLLGLSRAWLMAGARGVIATLWPVEDSRGEIFTRFYQQLPRTDAAEALRLSQVEMAHSGSWRARPSYWASYSLVGGER
ncbi:MAG: CHAT domain-containing tetratricopeptide repeat protein [Bryobacteraceae bacterium]